MKCPRVRKYAYHLKTIDSHTEGEATRIVYDGFPELHGETMMDKKKYLMDHYDFLRTALMLEPRGHRDMFGALLTEPVHKEADYGVIFMDSGGCLNMCGHGSIGTASMLVETGMVDVREPYTEVVLDSPSGLIRAKVHVVDGEADRDVGRPVSDQVPRLDLLPVLEGQVAVFSRRSHLRLLGSI